MRLKAFHALSIAAFLLMLTPAFAAAVSVRVTYEITGGSASPFLGESSSHPITSGSLVITWPNAISLYSALPTATATVKILSLLASNVGLLYFFGWKALIIPIAAVLLITLGTFLYDTIKAGRRK